MGIAMRERQLEPFVVFVIQEGGRVNRKKGAATKKKEGKKGRKEGKEGQEEEE